MGKGWLVSCRVTTVRAASVTCFNNKGCKLQELQRIFIYKVTFRCPTLIVTRGSVKISQIFIYPRRLPDCTALIRKCLACTLSKRFAHRSGSYKSYY